jgi:hypothetical protein
VPPLATLPGDRIKVPVERVAGLAADRELTAETPRYIGEEARIGKEAWTGILEGFDDASYWQTWSYGAMRWDQHWLRHVLLRQGSEIVAAAQAVVIRSPLVRAGIAVVRSGPLWRLRGRNENPEIFRQMLRTLREVNTVQQGMLLRIFLNNCEDGTGALRAILAEEGFAHERSNTAERTTLIDLSYSLEELRNTLKRQWKQNLRQAERNPLEIVEGVEDDLAEAIPRLYREMERRRGVHQLRDVLYFRRVQRDLPDALKMRIMIAKHRCEPVAGLVVSPLGPKALLIFAAAANQGRELRASYLLHWRMLETLKARNFRWFDLAGTCQFRAGLAGKLGREVGCMGRFRARGNTASRLLVKIGDRVRPGYETLKLRLGQSR